jgi:hypothetical protein
MIWSISQQPDIKLYLTEDEIKKDERVLEISWVVFDYIKSVTRRVVVVFWDMNSPSLEQWKEYDELWDKIYIPKTELSTLEQEGRVSARFDGRMIKYYLLLKERLTSEDLFWYEYLEEKLSDNSI